jgi:tetrahydromethanopterin S-methyltransferase subunit C
MARSHHRKKHKEHLRQFRHSQEGLSTTSPSARTKASVVMGIAGAVLGFAVAYFATNGSIPWIIGGLVVGAVGGYYLGKTIDRSK